jgi:hypothetical protein
VATASVAGVAAAGGLFLPDLYRDNTFKTVAWWGTDIATLALVVPLALVHSSDGLADDPTYGGPDGKEEP